MRVMGHMNIQLRPYLICLPFSENIQLIEGLTVGIVGDISHSRVALSNIHGLLKMGAKVIFCGPATLIPREIEKLGVDVCYNMWMKYWDRLMS